MDCTPVHMLSTVKNETLFFINFSAQDASILNIPSGQSSAKLPVTRLLGHSVTRLLGHSVTWSLSYSVTRVTRSLCHLVTMSFCHSVSTMLHNTTNQHTTLGLTGMLCRQKCINLHFQPYISWHIIPGHKSFPLKSPFLSPVIITVQPFSILIN